MSDGIFDDLEKVFDEIKNDLDIVTDKIKIDLIYAFNGTGKTRISRLFKDSLDEKVLCFNSMFQDEFYWDNENSILIINKNSWIAKFVIDQGLENTIGSHFQLFCNNTVEASIDLELGIVEFRAKTIDGYDENIKMSKAEESLFIWSVFYTFVDSMIYELNETEENRSTDIFNNIEYLIIDDPVSSIDDIKILNIAVKIFDLIEKFNNISSKKPSILITTHHALFYNSIYNLFNRANYISFKSYILDKKNYNYSLNKKGDSPFGYHLILVDKIKKAIDNSELEKIHFNMFRILLEKTANYFGYKKYDECLPEKEYKKEIIKLISLYSHGSLPEFEYSELTDHEKEMFIDAFNDFVNYYKM